jgi:hypothetical protein
VVIRRGWTREETIGREQSSWLAIGLVFRQEKFGGTEHRSTMVGQREVSCIQ